MNDIDFTDRLDIRNQNFHNDTWFFRKFWLRFLLMCKKYPVPIAHLHNTKKCCKIKQINEKGQVWFMAKPAKTIFVCNECGYESVKWLGKCPACNSWNTFFEQKIEKVTENGIKKIKERNEPKALNSYKGQEVSRISTGFGELDRVLGGGIVKGSLILLGGEPGIGKSTLILELCDKIKGDGKVLYVSGEESAEQI